MSTSDYTKVFKQLDVKKAKKEKYIKHNKPKERSCGVARKKCRRCGSHRAHVNMYHLFFCRRCFRELAKRIGFKKFS